MSQLESSPAPQMSRRQVLEALSGLLLALFTSMVSTTVVGTSLPVIVPELGGSQAAYTWIVTMSLLTMAISTPIWGKLADLYNRKTLILVALVLFVLASAAAGLSQDVGTLITVRAFQGIGTGGLAALSQVLLADILSPRERGRYMGLFSAVMAIATVGAPLLGGLLTDSVGWRWNFYVGIPLALIAFVVLWRTLNIERHPARKVSIDYLGIVLLSGSVGLLLVWITNVGDYGWASMETLVMVGIALILGVVFVLVELRSREPLIPMTLFANRTFTLAVIASVPIGVALFGTSVYLSQYMQIARGFGPTQAGLLTIPMAAGMLVASTAVGALVTKYGRWKSYLIVGGVLMVTGSSLLATLHYDTSLVLVGIYMAVLGAGVGMTMQNLVLVVQNSSRPDQLGVASSSVNFFRTVGGTAGVATMGTVLATSMTNQFTDRAADIGAAVASLGDEGKAILATIQSGTVPATRDMPEAIRVIVEDIAAVGIAHAFLISVPMAIITLVAIIFLPNKTLSTKTNVERLREQREANFSVAGAETGTTPTIDRDAADRR